VHILMKVETHNHPTAIAPDPGAATGSGGEIRDEGATGRGAKPKAGLCGFSVSNLRIPGFEQPWEQGQDWGRPGRIVSALDIMLEGPIGAAAFNNEFGRPNLAGWFRTFEQQVPTAVRRPTNCAATTSPSCSPAARQHPRRARRESAFPAGTPLVVLGGPAMLIGLGGGAASSMASGASAEDLDFASVQRANPEMERRCQEVIDRCWARGDANPILFIHDVGAGGLSNALPELVRRRRAAAGASSCAGCRTPTPACRRWRSGATRRRSATCWPSTRDRWPSSRHLRARALPLRRGRRGHRRGAAAPRRRALRRRPHRHAHGPAVRQAAEDAARRDPLAAPSTRFDRGIDLATPCSACCGCRRWRTRPS
jgi:hypothetical protein